MILWVAVVRSNFHTRELLLSIAYLILRFQGSRMPMAMKLAARPISWWSSMSIGPWDRFPFSPFMMVRISRVTN